MTDITVAIILHDEGRLCLPTLRSVSLAVAAARARGLACEISATIDRGDAATWEAVDAFRDEIAIERRDFGDLAASRNFAASRARGECIAFIDGDDLMGASWLVAAWETTRANAHREVIVHARVNYFFGRNIKPVCWVIPDMDHDAVDLDHLRFANLWTAMSFARATTYRRIPYRRNRIDEGFGYEDWVWNHETARAGVPHLAPDGTIYFIRRKETGSLHALSRLRGVIPDFAPEPPS